ncbi:hypothetical protein KP803_03155 [Vibrio sp. ZSDE26]|uniref:DUF6701 domain-containing protein n=1 Tax=Vibrio amylolyticus TaxID=2847292 RepID=A0A9X1XFX8_9VIBR|nr:DUF6701 domain-containing protein [Vibrio amylolyticus]MCK6262272.1 hypothetical protein [Vibrio amylolyticus]
MKFWSFLVLISVWSYSTFSSASGFDSDTCEELSSNGDFSVRFEIEDADLEETIWAEKGVGNNPVDPIAIWTDDLSVLASTIRAGSEIEEDNDYKVWLSYKSSEGGNNKSGLLTYYLWIGGSWDEISSNIADLSGLSSVNVEIDEEGVDELECSTDLTPPPLPEYSDDAQYEFGVKQCASMPCTINFTKDYDFTPLVFVMPTIDTVDPDEDKPATLYISSTLTASSTSVQINKDTVNIPQMDNDVLITEVSYLIIEPGVADFNGHEVIAGYLDTNRYKSKNGTNGNAEAVVYYEFGARQVFNSPVVLHQVQTRVNGNKWITSGKAIGNRENTEARLFLELSASREGNRYQEERIGFIATNSTSGSIDVDGYSVVFQRGFKSVNQQGQDPMYDGCTKAYADISSLDRVDGIIGKKQERRGGHGGWTRRCEIKDDNQVSFVIDEDFRDRTHLQEELGYFAFEQLESDFMDICKYTPSIAQTNSYYNGAVYDGRLVFTSGAGNKIAVPEDGLAMSFKDNDGGIAQCVYPSSEQSCIVDDSIIYPDFPIQLDDFDTNSASDVNCTDTSCTLEPGTYKDVKISEDSILTLNSGVYYVNELNFEEENAELRVNGEVEIHYKKIYLQKDGALINKDGDPNNLLLIGHGEDAFAEVKASNIEFFGYWYVDHLATNQGGFDVEGDDNQFHGGITAYNISMSGWRNELNGILPNECGGTPPSSTYRIELTPASDIALTCEDLSLTATVYKDDVVDSSYNGSITFSTDDGQSDQNKNAVEGVAEFSLSVTQTSTVSAEVSTTIDSSTYTDDGSYDFVPYKFDVPDQYLIAAKPESVTAKVLACDSGEVVDVGYSGTPTITSNMVQPSSGSGTLTYAPIFSGGTSTDESSSIEFSESGQLTVTLTDGSFNCDGYDDCPIEGEDELTGAFSVRSRPWTFAICSDDDVSGNATDASSTSYKASGTVFSTTVKPIAWQSGGSETEPVDTSSYCGATVTQNFFISDAPGAIVEMTHDVDTPSGGINGNLTGTLEKNHDNKSSAGSHYDYSNLSWDEVGSIRLKVDTQGTYLGMDINQGYRNIGRFYPAFFKVIDTRWDYPDSLPHVYMGQPFDGLDFDVEALNSNNGAVQNYPLFATGLKAKFNLFEDSSFGSRFVSPAFGDGSWAVNNSRSVGTFNNTVANDCSDSICWNKQDNVDPDGPFNAAEDIEDSNIILDGALSIINTDPIAYTTDGKILTDQPDIRFGRIRLKDVGGNQETNITVPLTVEYWNGSRFITNSEDNSTAFEGGDYCHQLIWSDIGTDNASLSGTGSVSLGESRELVASQSDPTREQVRFWLVLGSPEEENGESSSCNGSDNGLPWLRYNWDGADGDEEDPSTVVTFGIHRGNDRVIFRGESGLTGQ